METPTDIFFFGHTHKKFGYLSNFYPCEFIDAKGTKFNCSEQYFMYHKAMMFDSKNVKNIEALMKEKDPKKIKKYGRSVKGYDEAAWGKVRRAIMYNGLLLKFGQNEKLLQELLKTSPKKLYEASPYDNVWGIGISAKDAILTDKSKYGKNYLGRALKRVRKHFMKQLKMNDENGG